MNRRKMTKRGLLRGKGFTLIELLAVILIIVLIIGITFPAISAIRNSTVVSNGVNAVKVGVAAARVYALDQTAFLDDLDPNTPGLTTGQFSGTAIVFTPANEMRIVINDQKAMTFDDQRNESVRMEYYAKYRNRYFNATLPEDAFNGYSDVPDREYIKIPRDSGVVGILRDANGLQLITPPFAIRFNEFGHMVTGGLNINNPTDKVYYDGNYDQVFNTNFNTETDLGNGADAGACARPAGDDYNVNQWDPISKIFVSTVYDEESGQYYLPYEQLPCVAGIIIYSKIDFEQDGGDWSKESQNFTAMNPNARPKRSYNSYGPQGELNEWMQVNGKMIFFSRFTGVPMQEFGKTRQQGGS